MKTPLTPLNEKERLQELISFALLDTAAEEVFDEITRYASEFIGCPIALISLIDSERQWFKSKVGLNADQTPRDVSFCGHAILQDDIFVVEDASKDERFSDNPLCLSDPHVIFYAGVPLKTEANIRIGTLCVIDSKPRTLTALQKQTLKFLGSQVVTLMKQRRQMIELAKIKQNFEDIQNLTLSGSWRLHVATQETFWSTGVYQIYGLSADIATNKAVGLAQYVEHEQSKLTVYLDNCIKNGISFDDIFEFVDLNGNHKWVRSIGRAIRNPEGEITDIIGTIQDISENKVKEEALRASESKHRQLYQQSQDAVMLLSAPSWKFIDGNPKALELFAVPSIAAFKELGPWDVSPEFQPSGELSLDKAQYYISKALEIGSAFFEWEHKDLNGNQIPCTVLVSRIQEEDKIYLYATVRDIREEKKLNQEIQEARQYLDLALEGASLGIWDWNLTTNKVRYDEKWAQIRGVKIQDLKMDITDWDSRVHPDDLVLANQAIQKYLQGKSDFYEQVHRVRHADGHWISILGRGRFSAWDINGKPTRFTGTDLDITDLVSSQRKVELFFNQAPFGIVFCKEDGHFQDINKGFEKLFSYGFDDLQDMKFNDIIKSDEYTTDIAYNAFGVSQNGKMIPVQVSSFKIKDYDGQKGTWSIIEDISREQELKNEKQELLDETLYLNQRMQTIFNFAPVVVYECENNANWTMTYLNSSIEALAGYSEQEILHDRVISFADLILPEDRELVEKTINQSISGNESYSLNYRITHRSGEICWVWEQGIQLNESGRLIGVIIDITEKKKREEVIELISHVRSRFIGLLDNKKSFYDYLLQKILITTQSSFGFIGEVLQDDQGQYVKTYAITDISWDQASRDAYQTSRLSGLEFRNMKTLFGHVIESGEILITNDPPNNEYAGGLPFGHPKMSSFMGIPLLYNQKVFAMVGLANKPQGYHNHDIAYLHPFFEAVAEMLHTTRLNQELEVQKNITVHQSKLASVGQLAAGVGHEINNPLAIIQGQLEMIQRHMSKHDISDAVIKDRIEKSFMNIDRITQIVKGLRSLTRYDNPIMEPFCVSELTMQTLEMLKEFFLHDAVKINQDIYPDLYVYGNRGRFQQVIVNLLTNARDALKSTSDAEISIQLSLTNDMVMLRIRDNGPGVPIEVRDKIFDPFFTTKAVNEGTGIGLSIVNSIVSEHKGTIKLESLSDGCAFTVNLPNYKNNKNPVANSKASKTLSVLPQATVMVVDDESDIREILSEILEEMGLNVLSAQNGQEALDLFQKHSKDISLILTDIKMPVMDGLDFARHLKKLAYPGTIIFITGGTLRDSQEITSLSDLLITKPFDSETIMRIVTSYLKKS